MDSQDQRTERPSERTTYRHRSLESDDRAIEGLPIRLVIALVVGVAALSIMLNMLGGVGEFGETEVTIEWEDDHVLEESQLASTLSFSIVDDEGNDVDGSTVIVTAGSAQLDDPVYVDGGGEITIPDHAGLRQDQNTGTLEVEIVPPNDSNYVDEQSNPEIVLVNS
ncbi:hypothetical protein EA462_02655 [Natrarchaeobius halalkaliphilus]|uniref:DUF7382 domain-containing protein n=1 Tax=Natrarchaeobius halalkaliphilus TaxID=1679091 RepID=A0A3N6N4L0_9EURY|nr:hypothetical protein [Natrarchaeobius halalkaliphilus]RQG93122.1 hypothetical protein EA462_02655 [Natrarchaeobius halalkaliphilus]